MAWSFIESASCIVRPLAARELIAAEGSEAFARAARAIVSATVNKIVNDPFKALAHPIRRGIVERLAVGPATVGDATHGLGVSKPAISRHLKVLEESGVVARVTDGRTHRLSLEPEVLGEVSEWIDVQRARRERLFDVVDDYLKEDPR